jgi:hypothetical protein
VHVQILIGRQREVDRPASRSRGSWLAVPSRACRAGTGLRDTHAAQAGLDPATVEAVADDHKAYYPGATPIRMRITGDRATGRLLGAQLLGHGNAQIAKRVDVLVTAISYGATVADIADLDLSYTPPLGSPWDALQHAAHEWLTQTGSNRGTT